MRAGQRVGAGSRAAWRAAARIGARQRGDFAGAALGHGRRRAGSAHRRAQALRGSAGRRDPDDQRQRTLVAQLDRLHAEIVASRAPPLDLDGFDLAESPQRRRGTPAISHLRATASHFARKKMRDWQPGWWKDRWSSPKGLYIVGSVGVGKTFCMDLFYDVVSATSHSPPDGSDSLAPPDSGRAGTHARACRRAHFHEFMLDVHGRHDSNRPTKRIPFRPSR